MTDGKVYSYNPEENELLYGLETVCKFNSKNIVDLLNELEREKEYWRHALMECDSHRSILVNELGHVRQAGYDFSSSYKKYIEERDLEWMKRYSDNRRVKIRRLI